MAHRQDNFAHARLRSFVERIEQIQEEIDALNSDKSETYAEAKADGFDPKIMKIVISRRQMDKADRDERDNLIELYEKALTGAGKGSGTKSATRARAREAEGDDA